MAFCAQRSATETPDVLCAATRPVGPGAPESAFSGEAPVPGDALSADAEAEADESIGAAADESARAIADGSGPSGGDDDDGAAAGGGAQGACDGGTGCDDGGKGCAGDWSC